VVTRILFIESDEMSFQIRQCIAKVINNLPPVELFHAFDASEGLELLEYVNPDIVIMDSELEDERELFLDGLTEDHPPVVFQTETTSETSPKKQNPYKGSHSVTYMEKNGSLEGIHQTLLTATTIASNHSRVKDQLAVH